MFKVEYHNYLCHPETCCHEDHKSWWLIKDDELYMKFDSKEEAERKIQEIAAGHRIDHIGEANDMGDDSHIENHISKNCKVIDYD